MKNKFLGKKLKVNKDYDRICKVLSFQPTSSSRFAGKYEVDIPFVGKMLIQEPQLLNFFTIIDDEPPKAPLLSKKITKNPSEDVQQKLRKKRAALKLSKKDLLLKLVAEMELEDDIASSLKKDLLVEEILKEVFGEDYQAEG